MLTTVSKTQGVQFSFYVFFGRAPISEPFSYLEPKTSEKS